MAARSLLLVLVLLSAVAKSSAQHDGHSGGGNATALPIPDSCVTDPTQANCTAFKYPHKAAVADLNALCTAMSFMAGCSVAKRCQEVGAGPDNVTSPAAALVSNSSDTQACRVFQQVATVCRHDTGMSKMKGCTNYNSMCAEGSVVPQCENMTGIDILPTTRSLNEQVRSICEDMPNHDGCDECLPSWQANKTWGDCDLLSVYSRVCSEMPGMPQCNGLRKTCEADASLWICTDFAPAAKALAGKAGAAAAEEPDAAGNATAASLATTPPAASAKSGAIGTAAAVLLSVVLALAASACMVV